MGKERIKKVFKKVMDNNIPVGLAMKEVGYKTSTAAKPQNVTETKTWKQLIEKNLPDDLLARVHKQGLTATDPKSIIVGYEPSPIKGGKSVPQVKIVNEPDHAVRHKFLDTAYKIKGRYGDQGIGVAIQININEDKEKYA